MYGGRGISLFGLIYLIVGAASPASHHHSC
jgi:hypothetical protein